MCGRYAFDDIKEIYEARRILDEISSRLGREAAENVKTGEVFPGDTAAGVISSGGIQQADALLWGYPLKDTKRLVINARSETAFLLPMFRKSAVSKRCLLPCTGYFEWKKTQHGSEKYKIGLENGDMFYLGGLFEVYKDGSESIKRFVIITGEADKEIREIHTRMPLIITEDKKDEWFSAGLDSFGALFAEKKRLYARPAA